MGFRARTAMACLALVLFAAAALASDSKAPAERIGELIRDLGSDEFAVRERATRELLGLGITARNWLEQAVNDTDAEVRARARGILAAVSESDFRDRLEAFAADYDGRQKQTLPGWERFSSAFGANRMSRQLFVEMQRAEPELLLAFSRGGKAASDMLDERSRAILQEMMTVQTRERPTSLGTVASLLLVGSAEEVTLDEQLTMQLFSWLIYQSPFQRSATSGPWSPLLRKLIGAWVSKPTSPPATVQNLTIAVAFDLRPEALSVATRALAHETDPPPMRQIPLFAIGKFGGKEHVRLVEKLLGDKGVCGTLQANGPQGPRPVELQLRDVALSVLVRLTGQSLRDYGSAQPQANVNTSFGVPTLIFSDPAQRETALKKWSQWRAEHPDG